MVFDFLFMCGFSISVSLLLLLNNIKKKKLQRMKSYFAIKIPCKCCLHFCFVNTTQKTKRNITMFSVCLILWVNFYFRLFSFFITCFGYGTQTIYSMFHQLKSIFSAQHLNYDNKWKWFSSSFFFLFWKINYYNKSIEYEKQKRRPHHNRKEKKKIYG